MVTRYVSLLLGVATLAASHGPAWARQGSSSTTVITDDRVNAGAEVFPFYWVAGGPGEPQVNFGNAPMNRNVRLFYEQHFGKYPRVWEAPDGSRIVHENGSVPQSTDWDGHFAKLRQDIAAAIPDPNWSGYAIIDLEAWTPVWDLLGNEHMREESKRLVRVRFPDADEEQVEALAKEEFETEGLRFMVDTLEFAKAERPNAMWGYYGYPYTYQEDYRQEKLQPILDASDAFFPPIYVVYYSVLQSPNISGNERTLAYYEGEIRNKLSLAKAVAGSRPVMPLIWFRYHDNNHIHGGQWINDLDLNAMITVPKAEGASGAIYWDYIQSQHVAGYNEQFPARITPAIRQYLASLAPVQTPAPSSGGSSSSSSSSSSSGSSSSGGSAPFSNNVNTITADAGAGSGQSSDQPAGQSSGGSSGGSSSSAQGVTSENALASVTGDANAEAPAAAPAKKSKKKAKVIKVATAKRKTVAAKPMQVAVKSKKKTAQQTTQLTSAGDGRSDSAP